MRTSHNEYQRTYFAQPQRTWPRMAPTQGRYVERHLDRLLTALGPRPPARLLELGAGMGRFTYLLAKRGFQVTAVDLSDELLSVLRRDDPTGTIETIRADACSLEQLRPNSFEAAVGFFFLHHLNRLVELAHSLSRVLAPGGRLAFCEPNAFNPSFYLQILLTRGMTWAGDGGIRRMRPRTLTAAFTAAGFTPPAIERYGLFPPALAEKQAAITLEETIERMRVCEPLLAFQTISATLRD